jgi:hypothetical protein
MKTLWMRAKEMSELRSVRNESSLWMRIKERSGLRRMRNE